MQTYCGVGEPGRPRQSHKLEIGSSNLSPAIQPVSYLFSIITQLGKDVVMRKLTGLLALLAIVATIGCVQSTRVSAWNVNAGYDARAHAWEELHFTADLEGNPVKSELGLGFVTLRSHAGTGENPSGKWVSLNASIGP